MNRLDPANRLDWLDRLEHVDRMRRRTVLAPADRTQEPIYARLVAEWRAQGRTVPAEPEGLAAVRPVPAAGTRPAPGRS
ncbi:MULTISPECIES: hypothetical protein [unclassified Streptomyces]|jgi:hypothetical protein|uniref:hypothetical protein n=1 Tax=unclassified Streptomyces TaxID=2593676 RepID=UPI004040F72B